jgi:sugar lactone lactonase YvrE
MPITQVLLPDEGWQLVSSGHTFTEGPAVDAEGNVYFTDVHENKIFKINVDGKVDLFADETAATNGLMFGSDGRLYGCRNGDRKIVAYAQDGSFETIVDDVSSNDLVVTSDLGIYFTDREHDQVWYVPPKGEKRVVAKGFRPNGVILWRNQGTLVVTDSDELHLWTYRIEENGNLAFGEKYYQPLFHPSGKDKPGSDGMTVDTNGRLYVATYVGLQMFDPTGRLGGVIAKPQNKFLSNATFGGLERNILYVTCSDKVYRRLTKVKGAVYFGSAKQK